MLILLLLFSHPFDDIPVTHFVSSKPVDLIGYSEYLSREPRLGHGEHQRVRVDVGLLSQLPRLARPGERLRANDGSPAGDL